MGGQSKAIAGGIGAALSQILVWLIELFAPKGAEGQMFDIPETIEAAIAVVVCYAVVWIAPANKPAQPSETMLRLPAWTVWGAVTLLLLAGGCTPVQQAGVDAALSQAESGVKAFNDREAVALFQAPCAARVGGYFRVTADRPAVRDAIAVLCDPAQGQRLSFDQLLAISQALQILKNAGTPTLNEFPLLELPPEPEP